MTTSTEISAGTPLPAHRISASPDGSTLAIASGAHIAVLSAASGALLSSIDITAPSADGPSTPLVRLIAISPDGKHLAATGDDKVIRVWKMPALEGGSLVVEKAMPKRASCLLWERDATAVLVADKFGDLRVFPLDAVNVLADASAPPSKRPRIDPSAAAAEDATKSETTEKDPAADDDDEESDPALRPALGHVSMLTSVALADGPSSSSGAGRERYIITGDRDEHLRVSRWGPRRAGHVVENFLSGSTSFVGALAVLPSSACPAGSPAPLVLASDGGRFLRTWAYFANAPSPKCVAAVDVSAAILPHVSVDPEREKVREAGSSGGYTDAAGDEGKQRRGRRGKPPKQGKKGNQGAKEDNSEPAQLDPALLKRVEDGRLAIAQLHVFGQDARHWVLFTAEGSSSFFTLPLSSVLSSSDSASQTAAPADISSAVNSFSAGAPVLDIALLPPSENTELDSAGAPMARTRTRVWVTCETRREVFVRASGSGEEEELPALRLFEFDGEQFVEIDPLTQPDVHGAAALRNVNDTQHLPEAGSATFRAFAPAALSPSLALYPALTTYPKHALSPEAAAGIVHGNKEGKRAEGRAKNQAEIRQVVGEGNARS